jgi:predicted short-subunit dehydrogenase-like oxidoreductase (DUF2520 family)
VKITIIGTGNVAFHLTKRFKETGFILAETVGRNPEMGKNLAAQFQAKFQKNFNKIKTDSDLYIIAVSDSAIADVAAQLAQRLDNQLVVHTSGAIPSSILQSYFKHYGSFYPLQTFSLNSKPDFEKIPIFINTNPPQYQANFLKEIALKISPNVYELSDEKRVVLHIAAVFVNNFTNHLFSISEKILEAEGLPFDVLKPLIIETVNKIQEHSPQIMQTGPARRRDFGTIEKHMQYLAEYAPAEYWGLYKILTENIVASASAEPVLTASAVKATQNN